MANGSRSSVAASDGGLDVARVVNSLLTRADRYLSYGWRLLPLKPFEKRPDTSLLREMYSCPMTGQFKEAPATPVEVMEWFRRRPFLNLGVFPSESLALIDVDDLALLDPSIPTPTAASGREGGGKHLYLRCDRLLPTRRTAWGHLNPAHLVVPGSRHPSGRLYEWLPGRSPEDCPFMDYREAISLLGLEGKV